MGTRAISPRRGRWRLLAIIGTVLALCAGPVLPLGATAETIPPLSFGALRTEFGADGLSRPLPAPIPFSLAAVSLPTGSRGALRVSADGATWSRWLRFEQDEAGPGEPVWTGPALWLQVRGPAGEAAEVALVDSLGLARPVLQGLAARLRSAVASAWRPAGAEAAPARPGIVTRAAWGADERLRRGAPRYSDGVRALIVHHTAGGNDYPPEHGPAVVRAIYGYHTRVLGWDDIGYHLLADRHGRVYEGRAGGVERPVIGAHAGGFNERTSGVALMGSFQDAPPPPSAIRTLVEVLAWKAHVHGIDPRGSVVLRSGGSTRYPRGAQPTLHTISGHRDVSKTACPGQAVYSQLPSLREAVARRMQAAEPFPDSLLKLLPAARI